VLIFEANSEIQNTLVESVYRFGWAILAPGFEAWEIMPWAAIRMTKYGSIEDEYDDFKRHTAVGMAHERRQDDLRGLV
jgi:hypothetical protein